MLKLKEINVRRIQFIALLVILGGASSYYYLIRKFPAYTNISTQFTIYMDGIKKSEYPDGTLFDKSDIITLYKKRYKKDLTEIEQSLLQNISIERLGSGSGQFTLFNKLQENDPEAITAAEKFHKKMIDNFHQTMIKNFATLPMFQLLIKKDSIENSQDFLGFLDRLSTKIMQMASYLAMDKIDPRNATYYLKQKSLLDQINELTNDKIPSCAATPGI